MVGVRNVSVTVNELFLPTDASVRTAIFHFFSCILPVVTVSRLPLEFFSRFLVRTAFDAVPSAGYVFSPFFTSTPFLTSVIPPFPSGMVV